MRSRLRVHVLLVLAGELEEVPDLGVEVRERRELHTKVWNLLKLAGKNKQNVDADVAAQLISRDAGVSDLFWSTKK